MLNKSKKVLLLTTAYRPLVGGSELAIENITRRLPNIFFDIITPRYKKELPKLECSSNFCVHRLGLGRKFDKFLFPIFGFWKASKLSRTHPYQAVHAFQASHAAGAAWLLKLFSPQIKFLLTLQEGKDLERQSFWIKFFRRLILKRADLITGISAYLIDYARIINPKVKTVLVPNGVNLTAFNSLPPRGRPKIKRTPGLKEQLGLKEDSRVIITVSRLVAKNGVADIIKALMKIGEEISGVKLLIIGGGPLESKLKSQVSDLGLAGSVLFLGEVTPDQVPRFLKIADVFVRPSYSEGLGSAFLEAMAAGVPIIGTPVGGIPDFLIDPATNPDQATGLFCQAGNPQDLAAKIIEILANRDLRAKVSANAQLLVAERYNWDVIAKKFADIYADGN